ncbi:MAG: TVP38/TMEM64 family protein [bacterium]|nr:TVP38/TMEM64 family protein [bacterium]
MPNLIIEKNAGKGTKSEEPEPTKPLSSARRFGPLVALGTIAAFIYAMGWHRYLSFEQLATNREIITSTVKDYFILSVIGYGMVYAAVVALSLPVGLFLTVLGGFLFGPLIGGTTTVISATAGALLIFLIARTSLGETLAEKAGPWIEKLREGFKEHALNYLLFLRLVPAFPFWLVNIAPALLGVKTSTYIIGTLIGIIPGTFAFSYVGAGLGSVIEAQSHAYNECIAKAASDGVPAHCSVSLNPADLVTPELLLAFAALGVVAIIPVLINKFRKK